jgi:hypothetical protein
MVVNIKSQTYYYTSKLNEDGTMTETGHGSKVTNDNVKHYVYDSQTRDYVPVDQDVYNVYVKSVDSPEDFIHKYPFDLLAPEKEPREEREPRQFFNPFNVTGGDEPPYQPKPQQFIKRPIRVTFRPPPQQRPKFVFGGHASDHDCEVHRLRQENQYLKSLLN